MKKILNRSPWSLTGLMVVVLAVSIGLWISCGEKYNTVIEPEATQELVLSASNPQVRAVMEIQDRYTNEIMAKPGIVGIATGMTEDGKPAIIVFVKNDVLAKTAAIAKEIEEVPVITMVTGEFKAYKGPPGGGGGFDPTARHRPAPNGVSIGHPAITAGTLSCLVTDGTTTYILSNNHVMADENLASIGDDILQPGAFDGGTAPDDVIATLSDFEPIVFSLSANNVIDAAIAAVDPDSVTGATDPDADSYGQPQSMTIAASVGMKVMKYGRTSEHTKGRVSAINATVNIGYSTGTARFINQIIITPGSFSAGGDSGSLIVVQKGQDARKPVGLLYAGSSLQTIANPIDAVLTRFGVTVVDN